MTMLLKRIKWNPWKILLLLLCLSGCSHLMYAKRVEMQAVFSKEPRALLPGSWGEYTTRLGDYFNSRKATDKMITGILETTDEYVIWETTSYPSPQDLSERNKVISRAGGRNLFCSVIKNSIEQSESLSQKKNDNSLILYKHVCIDKNESYPEAIVEQCKMTSYLVDSENKGKQIDFSKSIESGTCYGRALPNGKSIPLGISLLDLEQNNYSEVSFLTETPLVESSKTSHKRATGFQKGLATLAYAEGMSIATGGGLLIGPISGIIAITAGDSLLNSAASIARNTKVTDGRIDKKTYIGEPETIKTVLGEFTTRPVIVQTDADYTTNAKQHLVNTKRHMVYSSKYKVFYSEFAPALGVVYSESTYRGANKKEEDLIMSAQYLSKLGMDYQSKLGGTVDYEKKAAERK